MIHAATVSLLLLAPCLAMLARVAALTDIQPDLATPPVSAGTPGPGKRVRQVNRDYAGSAVYHALYLPVDWTPDGHYPVIVEYAGNHYGSSPGTVDGSNLGYGISGGREAIWVCLPFVDSTHRRNAITWWGDIDATVAYCREAVRTVCRDFGGDPAAVFLAGFSRGAVACNFIGLHDDDIAALWRGFICHSHYDGVREWEYTGSDRAAAAARLKRLGDRPQWISHEITADAGVSLEATRRYLQAACPTGHFTFRELPFTEHTDTWVLRALPEREALRAWFRQAMPVADRP